MTLLVERSMFPLGVAHLPGDLVTLRIFEARYVTMVRHLLAGEEFVFGSVLITAGSEVGGGERRAGHGVLVEVKDCAATVEGGYAVVGIARETFSVVDWLADDPYPRALVATNDDTDLDATGSGGEALRARLVRLAQNIRTLLERCAESAEAGVGGFLPPREVLFSLRSIAGGSLDGLGAGPAARKGGAGGADSSSELGSALWLLARAVPCGPLDRLSMLAAQGLGARAGALEAVVEHVSEVLDFGR